MRRGPAIGWAYPFPVIRATYSRPAPRPHLLTLSGVETPVNLAFVEGPSALESPMEFSKRVLVVDDEPNVVGVLLEFFARFQHGHAYDVVPAYSAAQALDILLRGAFDLILLDMVIPGIGTRWKQGLDLLKRIRDLGVTTPVLMMSGAGDTRKEAEAFIAGAVGYLHKPFNLRDLDRSVALALGPRAASG
jgi:CheY-like chemotaxis protein